MCGICGKLYFEARQKDDFPALLKKMCNIMHHRGPDDEGYFFDERVGLGHKRLSIIDLSTGQQPLYNEDYTVAVIFNGEIYNYKPLRNFLLSKGHVFRTESDTEVIVHLYEEEDEKFLDRLRGMFAIALWDTKRKTLILARDRVGIKPLYYATNRESLVFGSEIKAILADSDYRRVEVNIEAIETFLRFYYTPGEETIFKNIRKLQPGHFLRVRDGAVEIKQYWDLKYEGKYASNSFGELKDSLDELLRETVRDHMLSDVPVGFLLSGGIDSTALLSYAVQETDRHISTFTVGFSGENFADERGYARLAAMRFGTRHYEITFESEDFLSFLPKYVWHMEEPVCEPPAIALYYISKLASEHVKVLISGEGADEAFAGYPNYANNLLAEGIKAYSPMTWRILSRILSGNLASRQGSRFGKYLDIFGKSMDGYYFSRASGPHTFFNRCAGQIYSDDMMRVRERNRIHQSTFCKYFDRSKSNGHLDRMLYVDTKSWLPDDLLIKADKITMANSVELRVPFLDHEVMEFAAKVPEKLKVRHYAGKYILKETLRSVVPEEIIRRKKTGFPVPYEKWMQNDFSEQITSILLDSKTINRGYFKKAGIENVIKENRLSRVFSREIFCLWILELWHRLFADVTQ